MLSAIHKEKLGHTNITTATIEQLDSHLVHAQPRVWLHRFCKRHQIRRHTGKAFASRCSTVADSELANRVRLTWTRWDRLVASVRSKMNPGDELVLANVDETFLRFRYGANSRYLRAKTDIGSLKMRSAHDEKAGATLMCFVTSSTSFRFRPHVIFGANEPSRAKKLEFQQAATQRIQSHDGNDLGKHWVDKKIFEKVLKSLPAQRAAMEQEMGRNVHVILNYPDGSLVCAEGYCFGSLHDLACRHEKSPCL